MIFKNRNQAAELLVEKLGQYKGERGVVIAIPKGGLPLGYILAKNLDFSLDVVLVKKIGHPVDREYALGSASLKGVVVGHNADVSPSYLEQETARLRKQLKSSDQLYHKDYPAIPLKDKVVIITDDGIATGKTLLAAIDLIRLEQPSKIVVAVPMAPPSAIPKIERLVDEVVCLQTPTDCHAVSQCYDDFQQVSDQTALELLEKARKLEIESHGN